MRIGLNCMLLAGNYSGVQQSIRRLVQALQRVDHENEYVLYAGADAPVPGFEDDRAEAPPARPGSWRVHRTPFKARRKTLRILWEQLRLPSLARKHGLDLLHCPGYVMPAALGTPSVVTVHDLIALKRPDLSKPSDVQHFKLRLPRTVKLATRIIAPSAASREDLVTLLGCDPAKISIVPFGVASEFRPLEPRCGDEVQFPDSGDAGDGARGLRGVQGLPERYVLFVGNLEPKKNLERLIQAFYAAVMNSKVRAQRGEGAEIDHKLLLVGQRGWGATHQKLTRLVQELDFGDRVFRTGYLPEAALPAVYNRADALLMPSLIEGFGFPVLEAMACGTPVVVSRDPALLETAGDAALAVEAEDLPALREAVERVLTDEPLRRELRAKGLAQARRFTWERTARATLAVYQDARRAWEAIGSD